MLTKLILKSCFVKPGPASPMMEVRSVSGYLLHHYALLVILDVNKYIAGDTIQATGFTVLATEVYEASDAPSRPAACLDTDNNHPSTCNTSSLTSQEDCTAPIFSLCLPVAGCSAKNWTFIYACNLFWQPCLDILQDMACDAQSMQRTRFLVICCT